MELKESNWKEWLSQPEIRNVALVCLRVWRKGNKSVYVYGDKECSLVKPRMMGW